jgi:hypothetical protein
MAASRPARRHRVFLIAILSLAALLVPGGVSASCMQLPPGTTPWDGADAVFVGTVTSVANNARWATVRVEEVWVGPDQPVEVVVRGGPEGNVATSVDRTYNVGARYVFGVAIVDGELTDSACSGTTVVEAIDLAEARPDGVRYPAGAPPTDAGGFDIAALVAPAMVAALVGLVLLGIVLVARRRAA